MNKKPFVAFCLAFVFILSANCLYAVHAELNSNITLPNYVEALIKAMHPNATAAQLTQYRIEWAKQLALNEEHAPDASGASDGFSPMLTTYRVNVLQTEVTGQGQVINPLYVRYAPDGYCCEETTPQSGDMAANMGEFNVGVAYGGTVSAYIGNTWTALLHNPDNENYIGVWASNNRYTPWENWQPIGMAHITSGLSWVYIGYTPSAYEYWDIGCICSGYDTYNDMIIDSMRIVG